MRRWVSSASVISRLANRTGSPSRVPTWSAMFSAGSGLALPRPGADDEQFAGPQPADRLVQVPPAGRQARVGAVLERVQHLGDGLRVRVQGGRPGERGGVLDAAADLVQVRVRIPVRRSRRSAGTAGATSEMFRRCHAASTRGAW